MSGSGGGGDTTTTTNTTAEPPAFQVPFIKDVLQQAQVQSQQPQVFFPGSTVAGLSPEQLLAQQSSLGAAGNIQNQLLPQLSGALDFGLNQALDPSTNPFFQSTVDATIGQATRNFTENILPSIRSQAISQGAFGGSREGITEALAAERSQQATLDAVSRLGSQAFGQGLDVFGRTLALAPQTAQLGLLPGQVQAAVGEQNQFLQQQLINEQIQRFNFEQLEPIQRLQTFAGLVGNPLGSTTVGQTEVSGGGGTGGSLSGALGGAATGASIGTAVPGIGTGVGASVGGLIGLLGL